MKKKKTWLKYFLVGEFHGPEALLVIFPFLYGKQKGLFNKITLFLPFTSNSVEEPYQLTNCQRRHLSSSHCLIALQGLIECLFSARGAILDLRWNHPWHCQVNIESTFDPRRWPLTSSQQTWWAHPLGRRSRYMPERTGKLDYKTHEQENFGPRIWVVTERQLCDRMNIFWRKARWRKPWRMWVADWQGQKITLGRWKIWRLKLSYPYCPKIAINPYSASF